MNRYPLRTLRAATIAAVMVCFSPSALAQFTIQPGQPAPSPVPKLQIPPFHVIRIQPHVAVQPVKTPGAILQSRSGRPYAMAWEAWATETIKLPLHDDIALEPSPAVALELSIGSDGKPGETRVLDPHHTDARLANIAKQLVSTWEFEIRRGPMMINAPPQVANQIEKLIEQLAVPSSITIVLHFSFDGPGPAARST